MTRASFNPSVGILFIQAAFEEWEGSLRTEVSIPRSGFCSFKRAQRGQSGGRMGRFNPSVGILFIQAGALSECRPTWASFNPSVGILFIQASRSVLFHFAKMGFQSLGRDSVHSSPALSRQHPLQCGFNPSVGILFIQAEQGWEDGYHEGRGVSIPRSGFCSFKPIECEMRG